MFNVYLGDQKISTVTEMKEAINVTRSIGPGCYKIYPVVTDQYGVQRIDKRRSICVVVPRPPPKLVNSWSYVRSPR